jgi:hypothetical protein
MTTHVNLIIATPGHSMMASYVQSLLDTMNVLGEKGITCTFATGYSSHVADAREVTLSGTLENSLVENRPLQGNLTYDKILWIDSDIAWAPEDVLALYESDKDIVSGAYLLANGQVVAYEQLLGPAFTIDQVQNMVEPIRIATCGFGFLCVKQGVFESLTRPWFQSAMVSHKDSITGEESTFPLMGEDMSWCKRATDAGFEIWFDPSVKVQHHKTMKLTWEGIRP